MNGTTLLKFVNQGGAEVAIPTALLADTKLAGRVGVADVVLSAEMDNAPKFCKEIFLPLLTLYTNSPLVSTPGELAKHLREHEYAMILNPYMVLEQPNLPQGVQLEAITRVASLRDIAAAIGHKALSNLCADVIWHMLMEMNNQILIAACLPLFVAKANAPTQIMRRQSITRYQTAKQRRNRGGLPPTKPIEEPENVAPRLLAQKSFKELASIKRGFGAVGEIVHENRPEIDQKIPELPAIETGSRSFY